MKIGYIALENFTKMDDGWQNYIEFAGIKNLEEVISLDGILCPEIIPEYDDECYEQMLLDFEVVGIYKNIDWVLKRTSNIANKNILAITFEPNASCEEYVFDERFEFCGYDLVDSFPGGNSALTNCGGFEKAFSNDELSKHGLVERYERVKDIQNILLKHYPDEDHAYTSLWGIWRFKE